MFILKVQYFNTKLSISYSSKIFKKFSTGLRGKNFMTIWNLNFYEIAYYCIIFQFKYNILYYNIPILDQHIISVQNRYSYAMIPIIAFKFNKSNVMTYPMNEVHSTPNCTAERGPSVFFFSFNCWLYVTGGVRKWVVYTLSGNVYLIHMYSIMYTLSILNTYNVYNIHIIHILSNVSWIK